MGKWKTDLDVVMKNCQFYPADPIAIHTFIQTFKRELEVLRIHEGATMWFLTPFLRDPVTATLQSRIAKEGGKESGILTTYLQVVNNLLGTYAADDIISEPHCMAI